MEDPPNAQVSCPSGRAQAVRRYALRVPIYDYRCEGCGADHEVIVLPPETPPTACPDCGSALTRRYGRVGVQLVGWGFARNDALVPEGRSRKDFRAIRDKAAELFD